MLYPVVHAVLPPLFKAIWRPVVEGLEHIPTEGPVILASNHLSFADSVVIPVGVIGTERLQPVGTTVPRVVKVTVRFGRPVEVAGRYDGVAPGKARREITDRVMAAIQELSGQ